MSPLAQHLSAHPGPFRIPGRLGVGMSPCTDAHPLLVLPKQLKSASVELPCHLLGAQVGFSP